MKRRKQPPTERAIARMTDPPRRDVLTAEERATVESRSIFDAEDVRALVRIMREHGGDRIVGELTSMIARAQTRYSNALAIIDRLAPKGE